MSATTRFRSLLAAVKALPDTRRRTIVLERDQQAIVATFRELQEQLGGVTALAARIQTIEGAIDRMHQTLVEADPQAALDIVTQVRDDVRSLLVEVTEQLNRDTGAPNSTTASETPTTQG